MATTLSSTTDSTPGVPISQGAPRAWVAWNLESVAKMPWARNRNLDGRAAVVEMYRAWDALVCEMPAGSALHSATVDDPQQDREPALQWIGHLRPALAQRAR